MKDILITILRDRNSTLAQYRDAAERLGTLLAIEASGKLPRKKVSVESPIAQTQGSTFQGKVMLVPILRSGLIFLNPFLHFYPEALIGFIGARRDEVTAIPEMYYSKLPPFNHHNPILLLDPMVATGGSAHLAVDVLKKAGALESQITLVSAIAAPEGLQHLKEALPKLTIIVAQIDERLNANKFIYPGLGDFGDRYFGTLDS
jgi:uracil phosphoribosyltransferase